MWAKLGVTPNAIDALLIKVGRNEIDPISSPGNVFLKPVG
jgi:hypothetical protein